MCQEGPAQSTVKWCCCWMTGWHGFLVNRSRFEAFSPNQVTLRIRQVIYHLRQVICPIPGTHCPRCTLIQLKKHTKNLSYPMTNRITLHYVFKTVICYMQTFETQHNFCNHSLALLHFKLYQKFKINDFGPSGVRRGYATVVSRGRGGGG